MKSYCFYHKETGLFAGVIMASNTVATIHANTPADHIALEYAGHDLGSTRFDLATRKIIPHAYPAPPEDKAADAAREIERLERSQHRAMRESVLGVAGGSDRLRAIDQQIAALRAKLAT